MDQDEAPRGILAWYDSTRPMFIDLVGDYAGKELFLVEGDSLLRECFEDDRIDFDGEFEVPSRLPVCCQRSQLGFGWHGHIDTTQTTSKLPSRKSLPVPLFATMTSRADEFRWFSIAAYSLRC